jgi:hypothetical protein
MKGPTKIRIEPTHLSRTWLVGYLKLQRVYCVIILNAIKKIYRLLRHLCDCVHQLQCMKGRHVAEIIV